MGIETQTLKPKEFDDLQVRGTRKRTRTSAAGGAGDASLSTCPAAAAAAVGGGTTEEAAILPRKKKAVVISNDGWGDFFKNKDNFVEMHIR